MNQLYIIVFDFLAIDNIIKTILLNVISSFIFIYLLLIYLKPKIKIVKFIAKSKSPFRNPNEFPNPDHHKICYAFKIINKSFFRAYDIHAKVNTYKIVQGKNKIMDKVINGSIALKTDEVNFIDKNKYFLSQNYGDHCIQFFTFEDLSAILEKDTYIEFQITAKHGLTGLSSTFIHEFVNINDIKKGLFESGNNEIIN
jgi:hypothetical protein